MNKGILLASRLIVLVLCASSTLAQTPAADPPAALSPVAQAAYDRVRTQFCTNAKVMECLGLEQPVCEANIESYVGSCRTQPDPRAAASNDSNYLVVYFSGCAVGGALKADPSRAGSFQSCLAVRLRQ
ncbi:MAG TPA: hypothetical protein VF522_07015 [Ramlibacter sp.]|uniref:hypothetical protein n=1 Tax=Ramlibacter sp. TaxID=1917967 RepID=UPI002ED303D2